ncbi:pyruvate:ferredoxin (flavodoxin) oxidoreductase [Desulfovibrio sp. OttesenSCG-928-A18]|nr:pyruvate:ferredoxin (flavodoxin) oxidoreductase [Desulfovibrio sp. OttesenSCG-928-A18]
MSTMQTLDGNQAAAHISYAFTEVAAIYPITPSSPMAEQVDVWSAQGRLNLFGQPVRLVEMQSEHGAAGALHGALETGALATSYTASQGLLLMVPAMYRMAGQLLPCVLHVSARTVGTHAFSIFGDHSDVMSCRQTGFAMLCTGSVQEIMDLAGVAHLAAVEGRVPFLHFFDGFRSSHELQKIEVMPYERLESLLNREALEAFRKNSLNPERPVQRSTVQNPDVFFQAREACNPYYDRLPDIVAGYMERISALTGRPYSLFNYYGAPDAERVVVAMGSVSGTLREVVDYCNASGGKVGFVQVSLYRPFSVAHFASALPASVRRITVLDRTKEAGAVGDPLYQDVCAALREMGHGAELYAGRYGLSSKDVTPGQILAVFNNMGGGPGLAASDAAPRNHFTVGIEDDVSFRSLPLAEADCTLDTGDPDSIRCKFWGLGSDGTVGANKNSIKIIGDNSELYAQAYFEYDTKKSGGITKSHLRFGPRPILSSYLVSSADFVACHNPSFIGKYDIVSDIKPGGVFLLNCPWSPEELERELPDSAKKAIAEKGVRLYVIDATRIAHEIGLGNRTNTVLQAAFFKLSRVLPLDDAVRLMKEAIAKTYKAKGQKVLDMNFAAVDQGVAAVREFSVPAAWALIQPPASAPVKGKACPAPNAGAADGGDALARYIRTVLEPVNALKGDSLPVSVFACNADGSVPLGSSRFEKRGIAVNVPQWLPDNCIQCNQCSYVCPHACIRPFLLDAAQAGAAPEGFELIEAGGKRLAGLFFRIQVDPLDCTGCGCCVQVCPAKEKALVMQSLAGQRGQMRNWDYVLSLPPRPNPLDKFTVKGSQFEQPLLEFSGACAGCGETPYMKLMTQLFGERMIIANATGCTQAWGAACPNVPYTVNSKGFGPAFSNSLFENNAEFSLGMCLAMRQQRDRLRLCAVKLHESSEDAALKQALADWLAGYDESEGTMERSAALLGALAASSEAARPEARELAANKEHLSRKSMWMYGGDGWAYDIGYGGLDHVLASGEDVNILVVDTEVYSNTGGQSSKATPLGAVAQFAASGKKVAKKNLGLLAAQSGTVYVAQVAMGADQAQLIRVLREAESFKGPSLIIAYAPCIAHGIVSGMAYAQEEAALAVKSGYWHLFRYDPRRKEAGENPFILDSKEPALPLRDFLRNEVRFTALARTFPDQAEELMARAEKAAAELMEKYKKLSGAL